jgi:phenylpropionate dioxygenase-like ring-hydroxylating dioxygenase large terminal subunit
MTRHGLDALHYRSQASFDREQSALFGKLWVFVGFTFMVAEKNQFLTRKVGGVPVLVQRTDAGLKAFVNECPHRLSAIQTTAVGKRPLVCPYHAWSFGADGALRGMPNQHLYGFSPQEQARICLKTLAIETVGSLIFVNLAPVPMPLEEQFSSDFLQQLHEVAEHLDEEVIYSCHRVNNNWKLAMENVKDHNHVPFVHPKTFSPAIQSLDHHASCELPGSSIADVFTRSGRPQLHELSYTASHALKPSPPWFARHCHVYEDQSHYRNWFIYPNVNFCSVKGAHFLLQQYEPVSAGHTDCHVWIMTARRLDSAPDMTALLATLMRGERTVIAEDTQVLERMQSGLNGVSSPFMHGDYEVPLAKQHVWYRFNVLGET